MQDLTFVSKQERTINVHSTLFKASAYIFDTLKGNTIEIELVKVYELYKDLNAILRAIEDGRFAMKESLPFINQKTEDTNAPNESDNAPQVKTPAERAAEVFEKKKRGRPRKNHAPET